MCLGEELSSVVGRLLFLSDSGVRQKAEFITCPCLRLFTCSSRESACFSSWVMSGFKMMPLGTDLLLERIDKASRGR